MDTRQIVRREAIISIVINALISALMFSVIFGFRTSPAVKGATGYAADFLPQLFMVSLMSALVPGLLTLKRHGNRNALRFFGLRGAPAYVARSLWLAVCVAVVAGGVLALSVNAFAPEILPTLPALTFKIIVGAVVAGLVTPLSVRHVLNAASARTSS